MPFVLGKGSGIKFTSETRAGTVLQLKADSWGLDIADSSIHISNISALRDKNIEGDLPDDDEWKKYGIPRQYMSGGMREAKITIHGFFYFNRFSSVNEKPEVPIVDEIGKLELQYTNENRQKVTIFKMNKAVVIDTKYKMEVDGVLEYDIELSSTDYEVDYIPHRR